MNTVKFSAVVNGKSITVEIPPNLRLIDLLRDILGLTGTKEGCGEGECGACTVLVDGKVINSCLMLAVQAQGKEIVTIEGVSQNGVENPIQQSFIEHGAVQCGYCTPGMVLAAKALLDKNASPTRQEIAVALSGNICRCTGYEKIIDAVAAAAEKMFSPKQQGEQTCELEHPVVKDNTKNAVGKSVVKKDAVAKVTGKSVFAADIRLDGMLQVKVLRSSLAHALVRNIDVSRACSLPGVAAVLTYKDIPGTNAFGIIVKDEPVLVVDKVRCKGDALAIVAAETEAIASKALDLIEVDYEEIPAVYSAKDAMQDEAPRVHAAGNILAADKIRKGDAEKALNSCDVVVTNNYCTQMVEHCYIEPETGIAYMDGDVVVIKACTQNPHYDRVDVAANLAVPLNKVRVVQTTTGGGFGGKLDISTQVHLALLTQKTGRPVRLVFDREESFLATSKRHPFFISYTSGATKNGLLKAVKVHFICDTGAYASYGPATMKRALVHATGPYEVPHVSVDGYCVYTNNPRAGAMRGFGAPQMAFAHESQMDALAVKLGISPLEIRMKNALRQGSVTATGQVIKESVGLVETIESVQEKYNQAMLEKRGRAE